MAFSTRRGLLVLTLGNVAGNAEVSFIQHHSVIDPLSDMAAGRTAAGQIQMHFTWMGRYRWLRVTRLAVNPRFMMVCMAAFAVRLLTKLRATSMTRRTTHIAVNIVIENQGARP
jgi:hypothetical protein